LVSKSLCFYLQKNRFKLYKAKHPHRDERSSTLIQSLWAARAACSPRRTYRPPFPALLLHGSVLTLARIHCSSECLGATRERESRGRMENLERKGILEQFHDSCQVF
jgi:hypothetical protein